MRALWAYKKVIAVADEDSALCHVSTIPSWLPFLPLEKTRMWVTSMDSSHEGLHRCVPASRPWRGGDTTWCTSHSRHLSGGLMTAKWASREDLSPPHGKLKAPWVRITSYYEGGGKTSWCVNSQMKMECSTRGVHPGSSSVGGLALRDAAAPKGNTSVQALKRIGGDQGEGESNVVDAEERTSNQGEEDPGEHWFQ